MLKRIFHLLFECPTFWRLTPSFTCPDCSGTYRCYWDGADCMCGTINLCRGCYRARHAFHDKQPVGTP